MKKRQRLLNLDAFGIIIILAIVVAFALVVLAVWYYHGRIPALNGPTSEDFCIEKCGGEENYVFSINDSSLNVIQCDCIYGGTIEASPYSGVREEVEEERLYFDFVSLEEISSGEVFNRFTSVS